MTSGSACKYRNTIYSFGFRTSGKINKLAVFSHDNKLNIKDSLMIDLEKENPLHFLPLYSDTLHGFLNIYLQKKENKKVTVIRITPQFTLLEKINNIDVARLNNVAMLG